MHLSTIDELDFDDTLPLSDFFDHETEDLRLDDSILESLISPTIFDQWSELAVIEEIEINAFIDDI